MSANFFFTGAVVVVVTGDEAPLFPGRLHAQGIVLKNLHYSRDNSVHFSLSVRDVAALRREARHFKGKVRFEKREGLPFFVQRLAHYSPLIITSACFFIFMIVLSAMIIRIDVQGADQEMKADVFAFLKKKGIREGAVTFEPLDTDRLSRQAARDIPGLTRFTIEKKGAVYYVEVAAEKKEKSAVIKSRHMKAAKSGVVRDLFVEYGVSKVRRGDFIEAGDRLISGSKKTPASGTVTAETWYKATVTLDENGLKIRNGEKRRNVFFYLNNEKYTILTPAPFSKPFQTEEKQYVFHFFSYQLPFSVRTKTDYALHQAEWSESTSEQEWRGIQSARAALMARLPREAVIEGENVLQKRVENGKVKMIIHFQVLENIAIH